MAKLFGFRCDPCEHSFSDWSDDPNVNRPPCPKCKKDTRREFSVACIVPGYMRAENLASNERQKAYMESPAARAKLDAGTHELGATRNRWNAD